jgi:hypothetical protein
LDFLAQPRRLLLLQDKGGTPTVARVQGLTGAMQFEHLFNECHADLKEAGNFRNSKTAFFDRRHDADS